MAPSAVQPDISYVPDVTKYKARTSRRLAAESLTKELPPGFPQRLDSPLAWKPSDFKLDEWVAPLTSSDVAELCSALDHFKGLNLPFGLISRSTFPLPTLGPKLRELSKELHEGRGFFVLRGFPIDLPRSDVVAAYAGLSSHVCSLRGYQDATGSVLVHITDLSATHAVGTPAYTNDRQVFHTDNGDVVSLLCLSEAASGGTSFLASSWHVYNLLAASRPDLISTLAQPWPCDGFGGEPKFYNRPVLFWNDEEKRLVIQYFRRLFTGFGALPRPDSIPPISEAQAEALDALQFLSEENSLKLGFEKGDIQFVNNLSIFHARDGYTDTEEKRRHLLRLWLRDEEYGWTIPGPLRKPPGRSWEGLHHREAGEEQRFPIEPEVKKE